MSPAPGRTLDILEIPLQENDPGARYLHSFSHIGALPNIPKVPLARVCGAGA